MGIDVIVLAKNSERTMGNILRQLRSQVPIENLIIVYGTSRDKTREIALQYTEQVYWDEDKGLGAARNLGMMKSSSEIVAMVDTDVILPKNWFQNLARHFDKNDKVAAAVATCIFGYGCPPLQKYHEIANSYREDQWGTHCILFKREAILTVGNFNKRIKGAGEDLDIYKRLIKAGYQWIWDRDVVVYHPQTLLENLKHNIWWARGVTSQNDGNAFSLFQLLGGELQIIKRGLFLAAVHPILSLYIPVIDSIWLATDFRTRSLRQRRAATS